MKRQHKNPLQLLALAALLFFAGSPAVSAQQRITGCTPVNRTTADLHAADGTRITVDFYGDNIVRIFCDPQGGILRDPQASPEAKILVDNPRRPLSHPLEVSSEGSDIVLRTARVEMAWSKATGCFTLTDLSDNTIVAQQAEPLAISERETSLVLKEQPLEYFYGGGLQNGRFSHKGNRIAIVNESTWTDGGVASPAPFYWSTAGYAVMCHTFSPGSYDFGAAEQGRVQLTHKSDYADLFIMVDPEPAQLLADYYQLTGEPVLLPKFGFYEGHLNAYNRDYWRVTDEPGRGVPFEDGKRYIESQKEKSGVQETLNGEKGSYQFSARAVIDRYAAHDMPLGWLLPNDGYGAGYGQTETLDGNIANLKSLGDYARSKGVEIGLWTQSDLHPKPEIPALLQRDLIKEVRDAGVRLLKTDVAWVGPGYSFGLNGITDASAIMSYYGNDARPFIITLDGWAGTQRYAGLWSGDQTGGQWEYIRFHIPTYICSGLSGNPNISSDMDGIFGGQKPIINVRDFQWKTFTPMELNMDGWGSNEKYPHALGEPCTSINRWYLKMKSELLPYTYSIAREAVEGKPMVRAMFLEFPNDYTYGKATQYQFMYGPSLLVAPVYRETEPDAEGNDLRNGIYLPQGDWIDYFSGELYPGGRILNHYAAPLWKLPLFVKAGAILPVTTPNNNLSQADNSLRIYEIYPAEGSNSFTEYDDDGISNGYLRGECATTLIESRLNKKGQATITLRPTLGSYDGMVTRKRTEVRVNVTGQPKSVALRLNGKKVKLTAAANAQEFADSHNAYYYDPAPRINTFATPGSAMEQVQVIKNPVLYVKCEESDITATTLQIELKECRYQASPAGLSRHGALSAPAGATIGQEGITPFSLTPTWQPVENADYYEIEFEGMIYSNIQTTQMIFEELQPQSSYDFKVRAVNADGCGEWSSTSAVTGIDPLLHAIKGIQGTTTVPNQGGQGCDKLFNCDENDMWHTRYSQKAVPFDLVADLQAINTLDRMEYLPRTAGNGIITGASLHISNDKIHWQRIDTLEWAANGETKVYTFAQKPQARYIKLSVGRAVGDFGSGRELYIFRQPGSKVILQGDINDDGRIDENDFTSYTNYTGLRSGDSDFDGYIVKGDINGNGLIDAYDISVVATQLDGGVQGGGAQLAGSFTLAADKSSYRAGDEVLITLKAEGMSSLNALSIAIPYSDADFEYIGIEAAGMAQMENLTTNRLHTNGERVLYPTFVNIGERPTLQGDGELFTIKMKARRNLKFSLRATRGMAVDHKLNCIEF